MEDWFLPKYGETRLHSLNTLPSKETQKGTMNVCLLSAFSRPEDAVSQLPTRWLSESADADPFGKHKVVDDPYDADMVLFVESHESDDPYMLAVTRHQAWRRHEDKCFLYHDADWAVPIARGVYPSIGKSDFQPERCRSGGYIARIESNPFVVYDPSPCARDYLYSFAGAANSAVRDSIFARKHPNGRVWNTSGRSLWELRGAALQSYQREYGEAIRRSHFVLCPRGYGPCTYRLFETMEMGRVPVVLSDEWVPPDGPPWDEFMFRFPENSVPNIGELLATQCDRAESMGRRAREVWLEWFSKQVAFHRLVEWCADLMQAQPGLFSAMRAWNVLLKPPHRRIWLGGEFRRMRVRARRLCSRSKT
jgi:hypothetical protein